MENEDELKKRKEELLKAIEGANKIAENYTDGGRRIVEDGQFVTDVAKATGDVVKETPANSLANVGQQIEGWKRLELQLHDANQHVIYTGNLGRVFTSTATSSSSFSVAGGIGTAFSPSENYIFKVEQLNKVLERADWAKKAQVELARLGLNFSPPSQRSALCLLQDAHQEFIRPAAANVTPEAVLLTVREAIHTSIDQLLKARPQQEAANKTSDKILSICTQCGKPGIQQRHLGNLAIDAKNILDQLSSVKGKAMNRDAVRTLFHAACNFLTAFLGVIDENKLRRMPHT